MGNLDNQELVNQMIEEWKDGMGYEPQDDPVWSNGYENYRPDASLFAQEFSKEFPILKLMENIRTQRN